MIELGSRFMRDRARFAQRHARAVTPRRTEPRTWVRHDRRQRSLVHARLRLRRAQDPIESRGRGSQRPRCSRRSGAEVFSGCATRVAARLMRPPRCRDIAHHLLPAMCRSRPTRWVQTSFVLSFRLPQPQSPPEARPKHIRSRQHALCRTAGICRASAAYDRRCGAPI